MNRIRDSETPVKASITIERSMTLLDKVHQSYFLDGLAKDFDEDLDGATLNFGLDNSWRVHKTHPEKFTSPSAALMYSRTPNGLVGRMLAGLEAFFDRPFESSLHAALDKDFSRYVLENPATFDQEQPGSKYATVRMPIHRQSVLDAAATFHDRAGRIVMAHNRQILGASLQYGHLLLVNLNYPENRATDLIAKPNDHVR